MNKWSHGNVDITNCQLKNSRTLLAKLDTILWGKLKLDWKKRGVSLPKLTSPDKVKKYYQRAVKLIHPDKCHNRNDNKIQHYICHTSFQRLNESWKIFEKKS